MKIAIDVADLDCERIDGTRVYIQNILKYLGKLAPEDEFFLFHKTEYNELLRPVKFGNYHDKSLGKGFWWTQIKFARAVRKLKPGVCWMPIQQTPFLNFSAQGGPAWGWKFSIFPPKADQPGAGNFQSIFNVLILNGRKNDRRVREVSVGSGTKYVVTIHDLAFKRELFPDHFPLIDRLKINFYTNVAVKRADKIIAISEATKKDLIKFYPKIDKEKIVVVRHGFDRENFEREFSEEEKREFLEKWKLNCGGNNNLKTPQNFRSSNFDPLYTGGGYLLYVGAIQPRKGLVTLIKAFNILKQSRTDAERTQKDAENVQTNFKKQDTRYKQISRNKTQDTNKFQETRHKIQTNGKLQMTNDSGEMTNDKLQMTNAKVQVDNKSQKAIDVSGLKLVLVGEKAWKSESTLREIDKSEFKDDIIVTGKVDFKELAMFYRLAKVFVFPSLYEGFGIPVLEAMASKVPVVIANNSSLPEVGGEAVLKFKAGDSNDLEKQLRKLLGNERLREEMIEKGLERVKGFSWERCARETLEVLRGI